MKNHNLSAKFLFGINSNDFVTDREMKDQYTLWLRQIARYFKQSDRCLSIIGHSSGTGAADYNEKLSLASARRIQELMLPEFPEVMRRSTALGRGCSENIVGSGSDDTRDSLDRRAEFKVASCS
ncbi:MAG: hypothetical protein ACT4PZ_14750 [Panacagrimonas sp.]